MEMNMRTLPHILGTTTLASLRGNADLPTAAFEIVQAALPTIVGVVDGFDSDVRKARGDSDMIAAAQTSALNRLSTVAASTIARLQGQLDALQAKMKLSPKADLVVIEYWKRMPHVLDSAGLLGAYFSAAEKHDDTTMVAVENAPGWDKFFALSTEQRRQARLIRWGELARQAEAIEDAIAQIASLTATVRNYVQPTVADPIREVQAQAE